MSAPEDRTIDLARMLVQMDDREEATQTLMVYICAVASLAGRSPRGILEDLLEVCPNDADWESTIRPAIERPPDE